MELNIQPRFRFGNEKVESGQTKNKKNKKNKEEEEEEEEEDEENSQQVFNEGAICK